MEDLAKADFRTIKTFISNNVTAERLLKDILQEAHPDKKHSAELLPLVQKVKVADEDLWADVQEDCDNPENSEDHADKKARRRKMKN